MEYKTKVHLNSSEDIIREFFDLFLRGLLGPFYFDSLAAFQVFVILIRKDM
jgi:hypothetical protein